ncbi:MAG TPA: hypothetical protein PLY34_20475, partial [Ferruginibacter sp.]|nr:hypothetical protein [Ferruginibacter sp.]
GATGPQGLNGPMGPQGPQGSSAANVLSGIVAIANGGTGSDTQNFVDLSTSQTINGAKTFTDNTTITGSITALSLMKAGGTADQFLKADGTVDNNTYLTTDNASSAYLPLAGGTLTGTLTGTDALFTGVTQINTELRLANAGGDIKWQITPDGDDLSFTQANMAPGQFVIQPGGNIIAKGNANFTGTLTTGALTYPNIDGTPGQILTTNGNGIVSWSAPAITELADEITAAAAQTSFTLTQAPSANSKVKMFVNGIRISNTAYSVTDNTITYDPLFNGGYIITVNDRVQFDYHY